MLEELMGMPAHPLLVHAAVVFVPLLAVLSVAYAFIPLVRPHVRWAVGLLALLTPVCALLAKLSGDAFFDRLDAAGEISADYYPKLEAHQDLGTLTLYASGVLAALALALVYAVRPAGTAGRAAGASGAARFVPLVLGVLSLVAAVISLYYVVRTGHSGADAVWSGL